MKGFFSGIAAYGQAFRLLFSKKFSWFLLFPCLVLTLLFIGGNFITSYFGDTLHNLFAHWLQEQISSISWLWWLNDVVGWLVKLIVRIVYYFLFVMYSGYLVMIVMSPIYSWLSEKVETHMTGRTYKFKLSEFIHDIIRGILISLRNMIFQTFLTIIIFFISFIPVIGWISPLVIFGISAYFYGFSFMDYAIERKRLNVKDSVKFVNNRVGKTIGVGVVFALSLMIPVLNVIVCSFVSLLSVIAGTIVVESKNQNIKRKNDSY